MNCTSCSNRGYHISSIAKDNQFHPMITKCPNPDCPYHSKYYERLRSNSSSSEPVQSPKPIEPEATNDPVKQSINVKLDMSQLMSSDPKVVTSYIHTQVYNAIREQKSKDNNIKPSLPQDQGDPETNQALSDPNPQESEDPSSYPHLDPRAVQQILKMPKNSLIMIDTPFGPRQVPSLTEANRIVGICNAYLSRSQEIEHADNQENVVVFPLGKSLGF